MTRKQTSFHSQISNSLMMFGWSWFSQLWWKSYQDSEELDLVLERKVVLDPLLLYCFDCIFDLYSILIYAMIIVSKWKVLVVLTCFSVFCQVNHAETPARELLYEVVLLLDVSVEWVNEPSASAPLDDDAVARQVRRGHRVSTSWGVDAMCTFHFGRDNY